MGSGGHERQTTGKFVVAQFRHDLSRATDPQLHTHCAILNVTQRQDGEWRALDNEPLYRNKMLLGALCRSELAREVQALGYDIGYTVWIAGRHVACLGRRGETHIERFPD